MCYTKIDEVAEKSPQQQLKVTRCVTQSTSILFSELVVVSEAWARMLHLPEANLLLLWDPCMLHSPLPDFIDLMPCLALLNNKARDEEGMLLPSGRRDALVTVACKLVKA
jgi:hypothetical protein